MMMHPKIWMIVSVATIVASIAITIIIPPVWGIDFVGGSLFEIEGKAEDAQQIQTALADTFHIPATAQPTQEGTITIRTSLLDDATHKNVISHLKEQGLMTGEEVSFQAVGPTIGKELRSKSIYAVIIVLVILIFYLAYTFRSVSQFISPWKLG